MTRSIIRLALLGLTAALLMGLVAACGGEEPEPTTDIQATIDAAVAAATPTETPVPEPTATPEPTQAPTPNIAATVAAALAAAALPTAAPAPPTAVPPTAVPQPTATPEPTATPAPTNTPVPAPTPTLPAEQSGPPCIVAGKVTVSGSTAGAGATVFARSQSGNIVIEAQTNAEGRYVLAITYFDMVFDLYVGSADSGQDTPTTARGCREIRNLSVN